LSGEDKVKRLVAFAILMEKHGSVLDKAPYYALEKYTSAMNLPVESLTQLFDASNKAKYEEYLRTWKI
jgi:hypothetical protein